MTVGRLTADMDELSNSLTSDMNHFFDFEGLFRYLGDLFFAPWTCRSEIELLTNILTSFSDLSTNICF